MNQGQFNAIMERLDRLIALLEAQQAATVAQVETAGEEKPKPATKGKK